MTPLPESVDGDHESVMLSAVREDAITFAGGVGACVSAHADVVAITEARRE